MPLTAQDVAEITRLLEQSDFDELHLEQDGLKLTLKRSAAAGRPRAATAAAAPAPAPEGERGEAEDAARTRDAQAAQPGTDRSVLEVTAPLVGIFYRAPRPGEPPYVEVGAAIEQDTIVGIIEVMKLMNAVRAGVTGTVCEILVRDGDAVEYGQVLLRVSPGVPGG